MLIEDLVIVSVQVVQADRCNLDVSENKDSEFRIVELYVILAAVG